MIMIDLQNLNSRWRREKNALNQEMFTESKMHKPVGLHCSARNAVRQKHVDTKKNSRVSLLITGDTSGTATPVSLMHYAAPPDPSGAVLQQLSFSFSLSGRS